MIRPLQSQEFSASDNVLNRTARHLCVMRCDPLKTRTTLLVVRVLASATSG